MNRRQFIKKHTSALLAIPFASKARQKTTHMEEPWLTIASVQNHLLPDRQGIPGASQINALAYLQKQLQHQQTSAQQREFIAQGTIWLNDIARENYQANFNALTIAQQETLLRQIEQSEAGERWLFYILDKLIEALLSSPVYGGNPGGIGWKWLKHQPGFPLPDAQHTWDKIGYYQEKSHV